MHARVFLAWAAAIFGLLWTVSIVGAGAARSIVRHSGFRLAVAASGGARLKGRTLDVLLGDSQLMDGLSADQINARRPDTPVLNLAFNGVESPDVLAVLDTFYRNCECRVRRLYINDGAFEDEEPGTSELEVFMAAFNPRLRGEILPENPTMRWSLRTFPLLYFNDEVFHRSFYYWLNGQDDQGHGNDYHFRMPSVIANHLGGVPKLVRVDEPRLRRIIELARTHETKLVVIVPPFHPVYVQNRMGFASYLADVRKLLESQGLPVLDHSRGIVTEHDGFADFVHLNLEGQKIYSAYFADHVLRGN